METQTNTNAASTQGRIASLLFNVLGRVDFFISETTIISVQAASLRLIIDTRVSFSKPSDT